jgi:hypothetical protein
MICTFTAGMVLIGSMLIQLFIGSSTTTLMVALGYHSLVVAAGVYVDYLMSARRRLGLRS